MNMHTATWAVVDTETTGPDPDTAKIVEVAVALFGGGELLEPPRSWLVNPGEPIPEDATAVHGISNEMVAGAPRLEEALGAICAAVAPAEVLVGYNALHFDFPLLARLGGPRWVAAIAGKPVVDPIVIVRHDGIGRYWKGPGRHRLGKVCERFGIDADGAHRAGADVVMTGRLLWRLGPLAVDAGLPADAHALAAELARLQVGQEADYQAYRARMGHRILAGRVSEVTLAGAGLLRIDIYPGDAAEPIASPMHPPSALYGLTPCTEERARRAAATRFYEGGMRLALPAPEPVTPGPVIIDEDAFRRGAESAPAPWSGDPMEDERFEAAEEATDMLLTVDAHMNDRLKVAKRLADAFGLEWPRGSGDDDEDEDGEDPTWPLGDDEAAAEREHAAAAAGTGAGPAGEDVAP